MIRLHYTQNSLPRRLKSVQIPQNESAEKLLRIQRHRCLFFNKAKFQNPHTSALPDTSYYRRTSAGSVPSVAKAFRNMRSSFWKKRVESWRNNEATRPEHTTFEARDFYLHFNLREVKSSDVRKEKQFFLLHKSYVKLAKDAFSDWSVVCMPTVNFVRCISYSYFTNNQSFIYSGYLFQNH